MKALEIAVQVHVSVCLLFEKLDNSNNVHGQGHTNSLNLGKEQIRLQQTLTTALNLKLKLRKEIQATFESVIKICGEEYIRSLFARVILNQVF